MKNKSPQFLIFSIMGAGLLSGCSHEFFNPVNGGFDTNQSANQNDSLSTMDNARSSFEHMDYETVSPSENETKVSRGLPEVPKSDKQYSWPIKEEANKNFDLGKKGQSEIKINAPMGTTVIATNNGVVANASQIPAYGNLVIVKHEDDFVSIYAHLDSITVKRGEVVSAGQKIGTVGKSGNVSKPQLGFEIRKKGNN